MSGYVSKNSDALFSRKDNGNVLLLSDGKNNIRIIGDTDEQTMIEIAKNIKYEY